MSARRTFVALASTLAAVLPLALAGPGLVGCGGDDDALLGRRDAIEGDDDDAHDEGDVDAADDDPSLGSEGVVPEQEDAGALPVAPPDAGAADAGPAPRAESPVPGKKVTYPYGVKNSRYAAGYHTGEDYAAATGTNLVAVRNGVVRWSNDNGGAYGKWMGIEADNGRVYVYCHLSVRSVGVGTTVKANQVVGKVGATGNVTGPHLHFEDHPKGPFKYAAGRKPAW